MNAVSFFVFFLTLVTRSGWCTPLYGNPHHTWYRLRGYRDWGLHIDVSPYSLDLAMVTQFNYCVLLFGQIVDGALVLGRPVGSQNFALYTLSCPFDVAPVITNSLLRTRNPVAANVQPWKDTSRVLKIGAYGGIEGPR